MSNKRDSPHSCQSYADLKCAMSFSQSLQLLMKKRGYSARELSKSTKIPHSTISAWLSGRAPRFSNELIELANFLGVSLEELMIGQSREEALIHELSSEKQDFIKIFSGLYRITLEKEKK